MLILPAVFRTPDSAREASLPGSCLEDFEASSAPACSIREGEIKPCGAWPMGSVFYMELACPRVKAISDPAKEKLPPATRNRTRDHLIAATVYSQMLYQLSYSRLALSSDLAPIRRE